MPFLAVNASPCRWCRWSVWWVASSLVGCSPALDWREVRPTNAAWVAMFPCRPVEQTRSVPLGGRSVAWRLTVCEAGGMTVAVGDGDLGDPGQTAAVLRGLRASALHSVAGAQEGQALPLQWTGATPQAEAGHWRFQGLDAQGQPVQVALWLAAHGTRVVQATLVAPALVEASVQSFAEGLGFPR